MLPACRRAACVRVTSIMTASVLASEPARFQKVSRTLWTLEVLNAPVLKEVDGSAAILYHALSFRPTV